MLATFDVKKHWENIRQFQAASISSVTLNMRVTRIAQPAFYQNDPTDSHPAYAITWNAVSGYIFGFSYQVGLRRVS